MFMVVSRWKAKPGMREEMVRVGPVMREFLRSRPGVTFVEAFENNEEVVVVHTYQDRNAYERIVQDPEGEFARAVNEHRLEEYGDWMGSESGETLG